MTLTPQQRRFWLESDLLFSFKQQPRLRVGATLKLAKVLWQLSEEAEARVRLQRYLYRVNELLAVPFAKLMLLKPGLTGHKRCELLHAMLAAFAKEKGDRRLTKILAAKGATPLNAPAEEKLNGQVLTLGRRAFLILFKRRQLALWSNLVWYFQLEAAKTYGFMVAQLESAAPVTRAQREAICAQILAKYHLLARLFVYEQPKMRAGLILTLGERRLDYSLPAILRRLERHLSHE